MLCLLCGRDRYMSRGALMLESSQCGGCGTLGNGGATLPRWMSSQFGGRCNIGIRGAQCAPSWVCVDPLTALTARYRVEEWSTHFEASCHPVYTCFLSSPPNTCHTPTCHTAGSKKTELPGDRIVGDLIELFPPRIELLANSSKTIKKMKLCRQGAD